jgi:zinc finger protein
MEGEQEQQQQVQQEGTVDDPLFSDIGAEEGPTRIESLCMNCHENGMTNLLLTKIPSFKEIILMSFHCKHCGFRNNEIQFGGTIAERGCLYKLVITDKGDLNRQVVKSDAASIYIPELDFEIPPLTQKGTLNTVEGFLLQSIEGLNQGQEERRTVAPDVATQIDAFVAKLEALKQGDKKFTFIIDDPAGNSFVENPSAPAADPNLTITHYERNREQNRALGISQALGEEDEDDDEEREAETDRQQQTLQKRGGGGGGLLSGADAEALVKRAEESAAEPLEEVMKFPETCGLCGKRGETRMCVAHIPHFKDVIIMAFMCEACGYKSNEVKSGGAIAAKGCKVTLRVTNADDLNRDVLKSETAGLEIPELELGLVPGTLGGKFSTIEGLLTTIRDDLKNNPFLRGDSAASSNRMIQLIEGLDDLLAFRSGPFTLVLDDPVANSYLQNIYAPDDDPNMIVEEYERSWDQNEELGLNDMKTENYREDTDDEEDDKKEEKKDEDEAEQKSS